jgi:hypothetical protein
VLEKGKLEPWVVINAPSGIEEGIMDMIKVRLLLTVPKT